MRKLLNPIGLLITHIAPMLILLGIMFSTYNIIDSEIDEVALALWSNFGIAFGLIVVFTIGFGIYFWRQKKELPLLFGLVSMFANATLLYMQLYYVDDLIPWSVPRWMVSADFPFYAVAWLMPAVVHSLFMVIAKLTPEDRPHRAWISFLIAVGIPILVYGFFQIIIPLLSTVDGIFRKSEFSVHIWLILLMTATLTFLFFLGRGIYIITLKSSPLWQKYQLLWKIPFTFIFPLVGLALNNGLLGAPGWGNDFYLFGNFTSEWFYFFAIATGIFLCMPNLKNTTYRIILFTFRLFTLAYTFYFFMVFLPWLPISILAIIGLGVGFLMLAPLVLMIIHVRELSHDIKFLKDHFSKPTRLALTLVIPALLPAIMAFTFMGDKAVIEEALEYVYTPNLDPDAPPCQIHPDKIKRVLKSIRESQVGAPRDLSNNGTPYISTFYNWLVLDNLVISQSKMNELEWIFLGKEGYSDGVRQWRSDQGVQIKTLAANSTWVDDGLGYYKTWLTINIEDTTNRSWQSEYATTLNLPEGCWISDYYLYNGDEKLPGILAEKRSALWIYQNIVSANRDPGLLHYLDRNNVGFRVFPFEGQQVRTTGIELIHRDTMQFQIDDHSVFIGDTLDHEYRRAKLPLTNPHADFVQGADKAKLPKLKSQPYYHFVVNCGIDVQDRMEDYIQRIEQFLKEAPDAAQNARITFANVNSKTINLSDNWQQQLQDYPKKGGFFTTRALQKIYYEISDDKAPLDPRIVIVGVPRGYGFSAKGLKDWHMLLPYLQPVYQISVQGNLQEVNWASQNRELQRSDTNEIEKIDRTLQAQTLLAWPNENDPQKFLLDDGKSSVIVHAPAFAGQIPELPKSEFEQGLVLDAIRQTHIKHPSQGSEDWLDAVKMSFKTGIMSSYTSFIALETEAQREVLLQKQKDVLAGNPSLDLSNQTRSMTEPELWLLLLLLPILEVMRRRRNRKTDPQ